ncbi:MAG: hypothetical protein U0929_15620 [Planctomycetaceae bacterium]
MARHPSRQIASERSAIALPKYTGTQAAGQSEGGELPSQKVHDTHRTPMIMPEIFEPPM